MVRLITVLISSTKKSRYKRVSVLKLAKNFNIHFFSKHFVHNLFLSYLEEISENFRRNNKVFRKFYYDLFILQLITMDLQTLVLVLSLVKFCDLGCNGLR